MRPEVQAFVTEGPLPGRDTDEDEIDRRVKQLEAISEPVTAEEAQALTSCFGPDDGYGAAWTLLHLIETGPGPVPVAQRPGPNAGEWHHTHWSRWGSLLDSADDGSAS
jgi:hypothetical protein